MKRFRNFISATFLWKCCSETAYPKPNIFKAVRNFKYFLEKCCSATLSLQFDSDTSGIFPYTTYDSPQVQFRYCSYRVANCLSLYMCPGGGGILPSQQNNLLRIITVSVYISIFQSKPLLLESQVSTLSITRHVIFR
jgi:hypothetical protein